LKFKSTLCLASISLLLLNGCSSISNKGLESNASKIPAAEPTFKEVSVHDPSVIKVNDTYYVFGSHLASAKSKDLMSWTQISTSAAPGNKLIPNAKEEMAEALKWAQTNTFWANDVIQLKDGKFYMYYSNCKGDSPVGDIGIAVSDNIEGPYKDKGMIIKSGMWNKPSEDSKIYNATVHPNAVDPNVFFDKEGILWMVYGSYSGGIFILKLNPDTGFPYPDKGYGKKLLGGNHSRIEAPYILYNPQTDYYYLFLSFGGLDAKGAYNIRVARSKTPDGPYLDANGTDMINCKGRTGTMFDDATIQAYGVKLMGNYKFEKVDGEQAKINKGYLSPGHNSAYYDKASGKYFIFFHTRFESRGEAHEVRVHQIFFNEDEWPVIAPYRYSGETAAKYSESEITGDFKLINHGSDISKVIKKSELITLSKNNKISGTKEGSWKLTGDHNIELTIDGVVYKGILSYQWDTDNKMYVMTFTALSDKGIAIWGSKFAK
jgi:arabinan endo-1,5-alpha-L-arabinosidase